MNTSKIIAHRGYARRFPENTLVSISAALQAGAVNVEFDVQFSADGVPVVLHDASLKRTTGIAKRIFDVESEELSKCLVNEAQQYPKIFAGVCIPTLEQVVTLLQGWPKATAFVEIKQESIDAFGIEKVIRALVAVCEPIIDRCVLISYDALPLRCSRAMGFSRIGYILKKYDPEHLSLTTELNPDFLICNHTKVPKGDTPLWTGPWSWVLYEIDRMDVALNLLERGADYLETMSVGGLINSAQFQAWSPVVEEEV